MATAELGLVAGDRVRFVVRDGRVAWLEALQTRAGAAADHSSRFYRWEVRMTPGQVADAIGRVGESVGQVKDLSPRRLGVSGRVVDLAVSGSEGAVVLHGLRIRSALGLRENLFVIDRERDPAGAVRAFVFTGKGWGHGVGLCQVGAFGMAQAGATYQQILSHYYTGITLKTAY
jgi:stage II sporulation protein D